jgi:chemotaxis-related protein WspD
VNDCWNQIGVQGDASCAELKKFIQCRHCPVYSRAAAELLNRPMPADYRREWTEHFARARQTVPTPQSSAIIFRIGPEWLALPTHVFQEVAEQRPVHSIPHRRGAVLVGLVNIRGELLICVSLGRLLSLDSTAPMEPSRTIYDRLLVANWDGERLVFPVDEVHGIHRFHSGQVGPPPATLPRSGGTFTEGVFAWQRKSVGLLDADQLFSTLNRSLS